MENNILLENILNGNADAISQFTESLSTQGWCLVTLPDTIIATVGKTSQKYISFFTKTPQQAKLLHSEYLGTDKPAIIPTDGPVLGYYISPGHKEGLRFLTGDRMKSLWEPIDVEEEMNNLSKVLHQTLIQLIKVTTDSLFKKPFSELAQEDIPLISGENFAMVDIAYYTHENHVKQGDVVQSVAPHYDPGILSLNVLSNQPGLQFKDKHQNWVDVPVSNNIGVIWAGELADKITDGRIKPGWHRVLCHRSNPVRMSIWIEACSKQQDLESSMSLLENITTKEEKSAQFQSISTEKPNRKRKSWDELKDIPPMQSLIVQPGQKLSSVLWDLSREYGIPMTKMVTYWCPFCLQNVPSLKSHAKEKHKEKISFAPGATSEW
jgi:hypothetical protein